MTAGRSNAELLRRPQGALHEGRASRHATRGDHSAEQGSERVVAIEENMLQLMPPGIPTLFCEWQGTWWASFCSAAAAASNRIWATGSATPAIIRPLPTNLKPSTGGP
jgi:hypothetical protein